MALPPRIDKGLPKRDKPKRPGDSKAHLDFIRSLPCCVTGHTPVDPHHLMRAVDDRPKGAGRRHEDRWAIPLSRATHEAAHANGDDEAFLAAHGIDGRALAESLWRAFNKHEDPEERLAAGLRIVSRCKQVARV